MNTDKEVKEKCFDWSPERDTFLEPYQIMDTPSEEEFEGIARLAAQVCGAKAGFISFLNHERQFFKATFGLGGITRAELTSGFCPFTVEKQDVLIIPDTLSEEKYARNPMVTGEPHVRFYAAVPVKDPVGHTLGAVCVCDSEPRELPDDQLAAMRILARQVEFLLALRRKRQEDSFTAARQEQIGLAMEAGRLGAFELDLATGKMECTAQCKANFGVPRDAEFNYDDLFTLIQEQDRTRVREAVTQAVRKNKPYAAEYGVLLPSGERRWIAARGRTVCDREGTPLRLLGVTQDMTEWHKSESARLSSDTALRLGEARVRSLYELTSRTDLEFDEKVDRLLAMGREWLRLDIGLLVHIDADCEMCEVAHVSSDTNVFPVGFTCPLSQTFCSVTVKSGPGSPPLALEHAGAQEKWRNHPCYNAFGCEAYIATVIWATSKGAGTLAFYSRTPRAEPFTEFDKDLVRLMAQWIGGEMARRESEAALRVNTAQQRRFVREMLASVTEGKLCLCDRVDDLPKLHKPASEPIVLASKTLRKLRLCVDEVATDLGLSDERKQDLLTAVGEASMNAVRHAGGGTAQVFVEETKKIIQVRIQDQGTGIREEDLHRATLEKGWSGAGSFGHGFFLMLRTVDRTYLLTGASGTTVILEQERVPPPPAWWQTI